MVLRSENEFPYDCWTDDPILSSLFQEVSHNIGPKIVVLGQVVPISSVRTPELGLRPGAD